jgi:putative ABC transport system permease protein
MSAVVRVAAGSLRTRWRGWILLTVLVAVGGGATLAAAAGAWRTSSAYPRFLQASKASDVLVSPPGTALGGYYRALAKLPGVAAVAPGVGLNIQPAARGEGGAVGEVPADGKLWHRVDAPKVLAGRLPRADRAGEIALDQNGAALLHVHVGSTLPMMALPDLPPGAKASAARTRRLTERIVGIVVTRSSIDPVTDIDKIPVIIATPALWHRLGHAYLGFDGAYVRLRPGTTAAGFGRQAQSLARRFPRTGGQIFVADEGAQAATVQRAIRPEAIALALFALVVAATTLLIVGQAAVRQLGASAADHPNLAALGMTRAQLAAAGLVEVGVAGAAGAVAAVTVAVAASPLMPIGMARLAEPDPGISMAGTALITGAVMIVVLLLAWTAWPAWRLASARAAGPGDAPSRPGDRSRLTASLASAGAPVTVTTGARFALDPGAGRAAVPVRSALAGTMLSVLAVTAAFTFGASLLQLVHTPARYGQIWDAAIDLQFGAITPAQARHLLGRGREVAGWSFGDHGTVGIGGTLVPAIGVAPGRGPLLSPTLLQGHPPRSARQIVLGTSTLSRLGLQVGDPVTVTVGGRRLRDRIVGRAVFPNFGQAASPRPTSARARRPRPRSCSPRTAPGGRRAGARRSSSCCCGSPPGSAARRAPRGSSGPWPATAGPFSSQPASSPTSARTG